MEIELRHLDEMEKELRRYCHDEHCRRIFGCPKSHPKCRTRLGLDTAIAWTAACLIRKNKQALCTPSEDYILTAMRERLSTLEAITWLNAEKTPKLHFMIRDVWLLIQGAYKPTARRGIPTKL